MSLPGFKIKDDLESYRKLDVSAAMFRIYGNRYQDYRRHWDSCLSTPSCGPLHLDVDLSDACNLSCAMCHQAYRKRTNARIDPMLLERVITEAVRLGLCAINFGASAEPLLEPELLFTALECAARIGIMDSFIHTNGLLLTSDVSRRLLGSGLKHICISLDAVTKQTYAKVRKNNAFDRLERNVLDIIRLRNESGADFPEVRVSFCVLPENIAEKIAFADKWKDVADLVEFQSYRRVDDLDVSIKDATSDVEGGGGLLLGGGQACHAMAEWRSFPVLRRLGRDCFWGS